MLRITQTRTKTHEQWTLCGQLTGPWVAELRACWEHYRQVDRQVAPHLAEIAHTVVDLSDVTFIDESGEKLLSQMRGEGAEFVAAGVDTKHLLKNLRAKGARPLRRCITPFAQRNQKTEMTKNEGSK